MAAHLMRQRSTSQPSQHTITGTRMLVAVRCRPIQGSEVSTAMHRFPNRQDTHYTSVLAVDERTGSICLVDPDSVGTYYSRIMNNSEKEIRGNGDDNEGPFVMKADKRYQFELVFGPDASNAQVYEKTLKPLVLDWVKRGYNATCFAYGMTGSGKSHTIFGDLNNPHLQKAHHRNECVSPESVLGISSLALHDLFAVTEELRSASDLQEEQENQSRSSTMKKEKIIIFASYLEIYNEKVGDLLLQQQNAEEEQEQHGASVPSTGGSKKYMINPRNPSHRPLDIREDAEHGCYIPHLTEIPVQTVADLEHLLQVGSAKRTKASTYTNAVSSRSHAILQFVVKRRVTSNQPQARGGSVVRGNNLLSFPPDKVYSGKLLLVDLAGSERAHPGCPVPSSSSDFDMGAVDSTRRHTMRRRREGAIINRSLLALGNCITILGSLSLKSEDQQSAVIRHIPYRDSKLTRLLKESLGGNTKTVMISNISPSCICYEETLSTLQYSSRAKCISQRVRQNKIVEEVELLEHQSEAIPQPLRLRSCSIFQQEEEHCKEGEDDERDMSGYYKELVLKLQEEVSSLRAQLDVTIQVNQRLPIKQPGGQAFQEEKKTSIEPAGVKDISERKEKGVQEDEDEDGNVTSRQKGIHNNTTNGGKRPSSVISQIRQWAAGISSSSCCQEGISHHHNRQPWGNTMGIRCDPSATPTASALTQISSNVPGKTIVGKRDGQLLSPLMSNNDTKNDEKGGTTSSRGISQRTSMSAPQSSLLDFSRVDQLLL